MRKKNIHRFLVLVLYSRKSFFEKLNIYSTKHLIDDVVVAAQRNELTA